MGLEKELSKLVETEIAVVMNDGQAYRGILKKFDSDVMLMEDIFETSNEDVDWVEAKGSKARSSTIKGYMHWRRITLPRVILRNEMVLRIWPWQPGKTKK